MNVDKIMNNLEKKHPGEVEYMQAVREVLDSIKEVYDENPGSNPPISSKGSLNLTDNSFKPMG